MENTKILLVKKEQMPTKELEEFIKRILVICKSEEIKEIEVGEKTKLKVPSLDIRDIKIDICYNKQENEREISDFREEIMKDLVKDFLVFCTYEGIEASNQNEKSFINIPRIGIDYREFIEGNFIDNQRRILEETLKQLEKINHKYSAKSMDKMMEIYLRCDLYRKSRICKWYGIKQKNTFLSAREEFEEMSEKEKTKDRELYRNAVILCCIKSRYYIGIGPEQLLEELKKLYFDAPRNDLSKLYEIKIKRDTRQINTAISKYNEFIGEKPIDDILLANVYERLGRCYSKYIHCKKDKNEAFRRASTICPELLLSKYCYTCNMEEELSGFVEGEKDKGRTVSGKYVGQIIKDMETKFDTQKMLSPIEVNYYNYYLIKLVYWYYHTEQYKNIIELEDKINTYKQKYIAENHFYEYFFGEEADLYRKMSELKISDGFLYSMLAIAQREVNRDMEKSDKYWKLHAISEEKGKIARIYLEKLFEHSVSLEELSKVKYSDKYKRVYIEEKQTQDTTEIPYEH